MEEGTRTALLAEGRLDEGIVERAIAAAEQAPVADRVSAGLETVIEIAEADPVAVRLALSRLRSDHAMLSRIESCLGDDRAERATLGLGAAIQIALSELACSDPDLRGRLPELRRWLRGSW